MSGDSPPDDAFFSSTVGSLIASVGKDRRQLVSGSDGGYCRLRPTAGGGDPQWQRLVPGGYYLPAVSVQAGRSVLCGLSYAANPTDFALPQEARARAAVRLP